LTVLAALLAGVTLYVYAQPTEQTFPTSPLVLPGNLMITGGLCWEPYMCTFDVMGTDSILGKNVDVAIMGYNSPSWKNAACDDEEWLGQKAANYLVDLMNNSYILFLVKPLKLERDSLIYSHLFVDGKDVAYLMIEEGYAVPYNEEVDWCEKATERLEASHRKKTHGQT